MRGQGVVAIRAGPYKCELAELIQIFDQSEVDAQRVLGNAVDNCDGADGPATLRSLAFASCSRMGVSQARTAGPQTGVDADLAPLLSS